MRIATSSLFHKKYSVIPNESADWRMNEESPTKKSIFYEEVKMGIKGRRSREGEKKGVII